VPAPHHLLSLLPLNPLEGTSVTANVNDSISNLSWVAESNGCAGAAQMLVRAAVARLWPRDD
jgi:hypothetical protein